jgi:hypothetical protein
MPAFLDLIEETVSHFDEGAKSVRAYASENTYIITRVKDSNHYWVAIEEEGFKKTKAESLEEFFQDVFGIEANY